MKIKLTEVPIKDLYDGYENDDDLGVFGYHGKLDIRPKYQREFIYKPNQQIAVIDSIMKDYPLNVMYWVKREDGTFEVMDGQQRTLSICSYLDGDFAIMQGKNPMYFSNLSQAEKDKILDYKLMIYICEGTDEEKLAWFRIINIAGVKFTDQELRNAVYAGPWVTDAKKHFSKRDCAAKGMADRYLSGDYRRQEYLQTALSWIADRDNTTIEGYMAAHQHDSNSNDLWLYFQSVINWIKANFTVRRDKEMKAVPWGILYNKHKNDALDPIDLENRIKALMEDSDVTKKSGIYSYVLGESEKELNIRAFDANMKREAYERQGGHCANGKHCVNGDPNKVWDISEMHADHITPWRLGGKTIASNCQMLCADCNRKKSGV